MVRAAKIGGAVALALAVAIGTILVLPMLPKTVDDAWISFRYAANVADGLGLVWDAAPPAVEGYSNLTWTLLVALGLALGAPLLPWVYGWSLALFAGTIVATAGCVRAAGGSRVAGVGAALLVATSAVMRPWLVTGLESPLMAFLITAGTWRLLVEVRAATVVTEAPTRLPRAPLSALLWGLVAVTRPEGALYLLVPAVAWLGVWLRARPRPRLADRRVAIMFALLLVPLTAQFVHRFVLYDALFANTGAAKLVWGQDAIRSGGWRYLLAALAYDPLLTALLAVGGALAVRSGRGLPLLSLVPAAAFVLVANGDNFGELRVLAPVVPVAMAGAILGLDAVAAARERRWRVLLGAVGALWVVAAAVTESRIVGIDRVSKPGGMDVSALDRLAPPWVTVHQRSDRPNDALFRWPTRPRIDTDWFVRLLVERLPPGEAFVFEDIGLVSYLLLDARLLDARGLTWPEAARLVTADLPPDAPVADVPEARAFLAAFHAEDPALVFLTCPVEGYQSPVERVLLPDAAFRARWRLTARGPYFSGRGRVCLYERADFASASVEVAEARYARLEAALPDLQDWTALRTALTTTPDDPARWWRVDAAGNLLEVAPTAERERGPRGEGGERRPRGEAGDRPPGKGRGEEERLRRRRARGLSD